MKVDKQETAGKDKFVFAYNGSGNCPVYRKN